MPLASIRTIGTALRVWLWLPRLGAFILRILRNPWGMFIFPANYSCYRDNGVSNASLCLLTQPSILMCKTQNLAVMGEHRFKRRRNKVVLDHSYKPPACKLQGTCPQTSWFWTICFDLKSVLVRGRSNLLLSVTRAAENRHPTQPEKVSEGFRPSPE